MKRFISIVTMILLALLIVNNSLTHQYLGILAGETFLVNQHSDPLYEEITIKGKEYEREPSDAKIDPVWGAIPGYNGLAVDVDASYKKMKEEGEFIAERLVFKQVKPGVHLKDLPPKPIYKGHPDKPMVSFIINVAWGNEFISPMLATLKKHNVRATFFLEGRWVKNHPELAKMISEAGHEVGNHSYSHPNMQQLSASAIRQEIYKTNDVIKATTGVSPVWLGPPSGSFRDEVIKIAAEEKMGTVLWSVDTIDWKKPTPEVLINRVMSKIHNGALILMHPTDATSKSLESLIKQIKAKNLEIDTVSELLSEDRVMKTVHLK
ncbi:polysaccharide deacetylase family protein [Bacillus dakarensis]|uniref:polysaccharide deacetylase family protein n=1 Tax=Robertmurraya dakarensis TaxID=1926278 RepID=UPI000981AA80|nr:polysaccharide deacetylase family protein [Bacillus dakarensis]